MNVVTMMMEVMSNGYSKILYEAADWEGYNNNRKAYVGKCVMLETT